MARIWREISILNPTEQARKIAVSLSCNSLFLLGLLCAAILLVAPTSSAIAAANDEKRLDPEIIVAESATSIAAADVSYSMIQNLCGDGDGCVIRLTMTNQNGQQMDTRYFVIGDDGRWSANINGGGMATAGDASDFTNEFVFTLGTTIYCRLEDNTEFDFIIVRKFLLSGEDLTVSPGAITCVLRVED